MILQTASSSLNPKSPLVMWSQRIALVLFLILTFALILLSKAETVLIERGRVVVVDVMTPVLAVLSLPVQSAARGIDNLAGIWVVHERNIQLAEDNRRRREWQELALHLQRENAALRAELGYVTEPSPGFVTARVIADSGGVFAQSLLVNAGTRDAVARDQPVVANGGLVGRVASVGTRSARILLLTDLNSRIPVTVGPAGHRGILVGDNSRRPSLRYLDSDSGVVAGDRVVTTGDGGIFPPGLAVGDVVSVELGAAGGTTGGAAGGTTGSTTGGAVIVEPLVDASTLYHVRLLQVAPRATDVE